MVLIENLSFTYHEHAHLFSGLNLQLPSGKIYGLAGKNGVGKTTLLKLIAGISFPQSGICKVCDFTPHRREAAFLQSIFVVPEAFELPDVTIKRYAHLYGPFYPRFSTAHFFNIIEDFMLQHDKVLPAFSAGEQRKVLLAFALASGCQWLFLDEPALALDIPSRSLFRKHLAQFVREESAVLISTHQLGELAQMIDVLILMEQGAIVIQESLVKIGEKLLFCTENNMPFGITPLYAEQHVGGKRIICQNRGDVESPVDLELLFKAFLKDKQALKGALQ
jgi:ABC-2 type transport system ATP-binding protein